MRCRLLYLIGQLGPGGSELQFFYLLREIDRDRHPPAVVVWNTSDGNTYLPLIRALGVAVHSFPEELSPTAKVKACRRLVMQIDPEVVHSYSFHLNFAAYYATQGTRAIAMGSTRSNFAIDWENSSWWLARLSARWPRNQVYNNYVAAEAVQRLKSPFVPRRVFVVRNGVDLERFKKFPLVPKSRVQILGVGSLLPLKRWDRLLLASRQLKRQGYDFSVRIVGEGPLRSSLEQEAQDLGISDRVTLTGYSSDIPSLLADSAFLVHSSDSEGCPNAVMEAMACGRPVVATNAGDIPHLVEEGKTGFVVRLSDDGGLAERMARLISDFALCRSMGEAARAKAEREFGLDRMVSETLAAYRASGWKDA